MKDLIIGGFYATQNKTHGGYSIYRVLFVEENGVDLSAYSNIFNKIPERINLEEMTFSTMAVRKDADGNISTVLYEVSEKVKSTLGGAFNAIIKADSIGIMHIPYTLKSFLASRPVLVDVHRLEIEDLDGYIYYLESLGLGKEDLIKMAEYICVQSMLNAEDYGKSNKWQDKGVM